MLQWDIYRLIPFQLYSYTGGSWINWCFCVDVILKSASCEWAWGWEWKRSQICYNGSSSDIRRYWPLVLATDNDLSQWACFDIHFKCSCLKSSKQTINSISIHYSTQQCSTNSLRLTHKYSFSVSIYIYNHSYSLKRIIFNFLLLYIGVAVGSGWQSSVAYINLGCYYLIGVPLGFVMGWGFQQGVMVCLLIFFVELWYILLL